MNPTTTDPLSLEDVAASFARAARSLYGTQAEIDVQFEAPRNPDFGDYASNVALRLAKTARKAPQAVATEIVERALADDAALRATVAGVQPVAGFINVRLSGAYWHRAIATILREGADYGRGRATGERISLEFGSANPTGPLLIVQGRSISIGSTLANALRFTGAEVVTDWIINDTGSQMDTLARSVYARYRQVSDAAFPFPENGYPAEYIVAVAEALRARDGDRWKDAPESEWFSHVMNFARDAMVASQQAVCRRFGADFIFQSERQFHDAGLVDAILDMLVAQDLTVRDGEAIALRADLFEDEDKDRILRRTDGRPTYYAADIVYHFAKFRHAEREIDILGPDHHGYIPRARGIAALYRRLYGTPALDAILKRIDALDLEGPTAWAGPSAEIDVLIAQHITLVRGGELVPMSKRAGHIVTLEEVLDEVGVDAARFFFAMLAPESPLTFDLELAVAQTNENPVYYVQYGHARIASILAKARENAATSALLAAAQRGEHLERLEHPAEYALARRLADFPRVIAAAAKALAPHRLTLYAREIAADFHQFYHACIVIGDDPDVTAARLGLALATQRVLAAVLGILGVSTPESMARRS